MACTLRISERLAITGLEWHILLCDAWKLVHADVLLDGRVTEHGAAVVGRTVARRRGLPVRLMWMMRRLSVGAKLLGRGVLSLLDGVCVIPCATTTQCEVATSGVLADGTPLLPRVASQRIRWTPFLGWLRCLTDHAKEIVLHLTEDLYASDDHDHSQCEENWRPARQVARQQIILIVVRTPPDQYSREYCRTAAPQPHPATENGASNRELQIGVDVLGAIDPCNGNQLEHQCRNDQCAHQTRVQHTCNQELGCRKGHHSHNQSNQADHIVGTTWHKASRGVDGHSDGHECRENDECVDERGHEVTQQLTLRLSAVLHTIVDRSQRLELFHQLISIRREVKLHHEQCHGDGIDQQVEAQIDHRGAHCVSLVQELARQHRQCAEAAIHREQHLHEGIEPDVALGQQRGVKDPQLGEVVSREGVAHLPASQGTQQKQSGQTVDKETTAQDLAVVGAAKQ